MIPNENDTIVAPATAIGSGARGVVRISGPDAINVLSSLVVDAPLDPPRTPQRLAGLPITILLAGKPHALLIDAWVWPTTRSYTRQPTVELHTPAAPPVVDAVVRACCQRRARLATPGEFTLRAFLSGRIDLTQAEAVLGVIEADGDAALRDALGRLAGGISTPLDALREDLAQLLAELEAGLDFVEEEDIRFVEPAELANRIAAGQQVARSAVEQTSARGETNAYPTVVLAGQPNAGKSALFNALRQRAAVDAAAGNAIVSPRAGTTRDALTALLESDGVRFWLIDTAGVDESQPVGIETLAADQTSRAVAAADLVLRCTPAGEAPQPREQELAVATKIDTAQPPAAGAIGTSAARGDGLDELIAAVVSRVAATEPPRAAIAAGASARCRQALAACEAALDRAAAIAATGDNELIAEELRQSLAALGDVVGATATDDLLDRIFGQFCIGK